MSLKVSSSSAFTSDLYALNDRHKQLEKDYNENPSQETLQEAFALQTQFYSSIDFFSQPHAEQFLKKTSLERILAARKLDPKCVFMMAGEVQFFKELLHYLNVVNGFLHMVRSILEMECSFIAGSGLEMRVRFPSNMIQDDRCLLLFLRIYPHAYTDQVVSSSIFTLNPEIKKELEELTRDPNPRIQMLAKIAQNLDCLERCFQIIKGVCFYRFNDVIAHGIYDLYGGVKLRELPKEAAIATVPGMIVLLKTMLKGIKTFRQHFYGNNDFYNAVNSLGEFFPDTFAACSTLTNNQYFIKQSTLIAALARTHGPIDIITETEGTISSDKIKTQFGKLQSLYQQLCTRFIIAKQDAPPSSPKPSSSKGPAKIPLNRRAKKKKVVKTPSPKAPSIPKPIACSSTTPALPDPVDTELHSFIQSVVNARHVNYHERVKRWMNCPRDKIESIREFRDKEEQLYAALPIHELEEHWHGHGYSSLVDRVFGDKTLKQIYSIKIPRGRALLGEIQKEGEDRVRGVFTYGFSKKPSTCFHRQFKPVSDADIMQRGLVTLLKSSLPTFEENEDGLSASASSLDSDLAEEFIGDEFNYDPKLKIFSVTDKVHRMRICILPF